MIMTSQITPRDCDHRWKVIRSLSYESMDGWSVELIMDQHACGIQRIWLVVLNMMLLLLNHYQWHDKRVSPKAKVTCAASSTSSALSMGSGGCAHSLLICTGSWAHSLLICRKTSSKTRVLRHSWSTDSNIVSHCALLNSKIGANTTCSRVFFISSTFAYWEMITCKSQFVGSVCTQVSICRLYAHPDDKFCRKDREHERNPIEPAPPVA